MEQGYILFVYNPVLLGALSPSLTPPSTAKTPTEMAISPPHLALPAQGPVKLHPQGGIGRDNTVDTQ